MIRYANENDFNSLKKYDIHINEGELLRCIKDKRVLIMFNNEIFVGWLRFNLFWDNTPFINMLFILEKYRKMGLGKQLINYWEKEMLDKGYAIVLTSTLSNENGQFFYRKNGYIDCGSLLLQGQSLEIIFFKELKSKNQQLK